MGFYRERVEVCGSKSAVTFIKIMSKHFLLETEENPNQDGQPSNRESNMERQK